MRLDGQEILKSQVDKETESILDALIDARMRDGGIGAWRVALLYTALDKLIAALSGGGFESALREAKFTVNTIDESLNRPVKYPRSDGTLAIRRDF